MEKSRKQPRLAVFITNFRDHFVREFVKGAEMAAARTGVQLIFAQTESRDVPIGSRYQYNALFDLFRFGSMDGLILPTGIMFNFSGVERAIEYCRSLGDFPVVSVGWPLPDYPSLYVDNRSGMAEALEHLIKCHGRRKIAFVKGLSLNYDSMERFNAFLETLSACDLLADPDLIVEGDFTPQSGTLAVDTLLLERGKTFDAVIASNDDMAMAVIKRLEQLGKRVPEDVSVIGFDNLQLSAVSLPGLSTIDQQICMQGYQSVHLLLQVIQGVSIPGQTVIRSGFVPRESCGCRSRHISLMFDDFPSVEGFCFPQEKDSSDRDGLAPLVDAVLAEPDNPDGFIRIERYLQQALKGGYGSDLLNRDAEQLFDSLTREHTRDLYVVKKVRLFIHLVLSASRGAYSLYDSMERIYAETEYLSRVREMVGASSLDDLKKWLTGFFRKFGIQRAFIGFFPEPLEYRRGDALSPPAEVIPFLLFRDGRLHPAGNGRALLPLNRFIPDPLWDTENLSSLICYPLFFMDEQYGYAIFEKENLPVYLLNTLADQIGASYRLLRTTDERERVEKKLRRVLLELEESNKELFNLSKTDELTGLKNRRGFFDTAGEVLDLARYRKMGGNLLFIDLDGLKRINDEFGHEQGDRAISAVAGILEKVFDKGEVLARLGGDEFIVLSTGSDEDYPQQAILRIKTALDEINRMESHPARLAVSMGASPFTAEDLKSLQELMADADDRLYREKNLKKQKKLVNGYPVSG